MSAGQPKIKRAVFGVRGMDCATCALGIEKRLKGVGGVESVKAAIMLNKVFVDYNESKIDASGVSAAIQKSGYANHLIRKE